jgi:uncharacterized membrane protein
VRTYALVTLVVVVATALFVRALDHPSRTNWVLYGVAASFAIYCHYYAGFVVAAQFLSIPFAPKRPPVGRVLEAGSTLVILSWTALHFTATADRGNLIWIPEPSPHVVLSALADTTGQNVALGVVAVAGLIVMARTAAPSTSDAGAWPSSADGAPFRLSLGCLRRPCCSRSSSPGT